MPFYCKCGAALEEEDLFCAECGRPRGKNSTVPPATEPIAVSPSPEADVGENVCVPAPASKTFRNTLLGVVAIALPVILGGYFIFGQHLAARTLQVTAVSANCGIPHILFAADFQDGAFSDWNIWIDWPTSANPGWELRAAEDGYCLEGRGHAFVTPPVMGWIDYTVRFRFNRLVGDFHFNIRQNNDSGHFRYYVGVNNGGLNLVKETTRNAAAGFPEADFHELAWVERYLQLDRWYALKASVQGSSIKIYLDDVMIIDYRDDDDPITHGRISFETHDHSVVLIDDIVVTREILSGTAVAIPEQDQVYIPPLQATVQALRFFESDKHILPMEERVYGSHFYRADTRFIWWELYLSCEPGRKTKFDLYAEYYDPTGEMIYAGFVDDLWIDRGWIESLHAAGFGYNLHDAWIPGIYRVKLYFDDAPIAAGEFEIYPYVKRNGF